jgi:hypothetical protein
MGPGYKKQSYYRIVYHLGGKRHQLNVVETGNARGYPIHSSMASPSRWLAWSWQLNSDLAAEFRPVVTEIRRPANLPSIIGTQRFIRFAR